MIDIPQPADIRSSRKRVMRKFWTDGNRPRVQGDRHAKREFYHHLWDVRFRELSK